MYPVTFYSLQPGYETGMVGMGKRHQPLISACEKFKYLEAWLRKRQTDRACEYEGQTGRNKLGTLGIEKLTEVTKRLSPRYLTKMWAFLGGWAVSE